MTCEEVTLLDCRIQGSLLPDTRVTITEEDIPIDPSTHTGWQVQGSPQGTTASSWTKTTGITTTSTEVVIGWAVGDLGACTPGTWMLELTGTLGGKPRKVRMLLPIDPEST